MNTVAAAIELLSDDRQIELIRRFDHGAGGTSLARLNGRPVVVKSWQTSEVRERALDAGLRCAQTMSARSVPIPRLLERGRVGAYSYLFYEFVEGEWPPRVDESLARQMLALIDRQRDAATHPDPQWRTRLASMITDGDTTLDVEPERLRDHHTGRHILSAARTALEACDPRNLHTTDIVHGDFAPENLLVSDGEITAVVDWEQGRVGDAAFDLAGMIYDVELGSKADPNVLSSLYRAIHTRVPSDAWQLYTGIYAVRYASWAINTDMETDVIDTIGRITDASTP